MSESALIYATYKNNLTENKDLAELTDYFGYGGNFDFGIDKSEKLKNLDNILDQTQIKRACCLGKKSIHVRIPLYTGLQIEDIQGSGDLRKEFKYFDKEVSVGDCRLPEYDKRNADNNTDIYNKCEEFYKVYCANMINDFKQENGGKWDLEKFLRYKPECSCFVPPPQGLPQGVNIVPRCFYDWCTSGNFNSNLIWLDKESRGGECDLNICNSKIDQDEFTAGGNVAVANKVIQICGDAGKSNPFATAGGNTYVPPPPSSPTPFPSYPPPPPVTPAPQPVIPSTPSIPNITTLDTPFGINPFIIAFVIFCMMMFSSMLLLIVV